MAPRKIPSKLASILALVLTLAAASGADRTEVKVLTIANSFGENATRFLPAIADSRGITITVGKANIGGSSLARHARHLLAYRNDPDDPEGRPYRDRAHPDRPNFSLVEALESDDWDFVTIQQFRGDSALAVTWRPDDLTGEQAASLRQAAHQAVAAGEMSPAPLTQR